MLIFCFVLLATADIRELALNPSDQYHAHPLENDMFEWHFTIRGAEGTDFEGGIYHGRILLPPEYPYKPPHIMFLTPSGRFETNTKICLSFSAFHPELWQPAWGIRLILEALISFLPTPGDGAIGALDYKPEERRRLAKQSQSFVCPTCGPVEKLLPKLDPDRKRSAKSGENAFSKQIAELQRLQKEREGGKKKSPPTPKSGKAEKAAVTPRTRAATQNEDERIRTKTPEGTKSEDVPGLLSADVGEDRKVAASTVGTATEEQIEVDNTDENNGSINTPAPDTIALIEDEPEPVPAQIEVEEVGADLSHLYDPLLNISILLMLCICILLFKKGMDLSRELKELRSTPIVDALMETATSAASSVAASATSEEL